MTVPSTPRESEIIPTLPGEPPTPTPAVTPPAERKSFYPPLAAFLRARYPSVKAPLPPPNGNAGPKPKSSLANEVEAVSSDLGESSESHEDTSESQATSEDEDDSSLPDAAETATLRGTSTESGRSRGGSASTVKASRPVEGLEDAANEKTAHPTSVPPRFVVQESTSIS
jgi:hypothetical protein